MSESEQTEQTVTFIGFVISLAHTAAVYFGDVVGPGEQAPTAANLPAAQQMIDILALLEQKTRGNLTAELRLRYVQAQKDDQERPRIIVP